MIVLYEKIRGDEQSVVVLEWISFITLSHMPSRLACNF
jgi:hypothetical protein